MHITSMDMPQCYFWKPQYLRPDTKEVLKSILKNLGILKYLGST